MARVPWKRKLWTQVLTCWQVTPRKTWSLWLSVHGVLWVKSQCGLWSFFIVCMKSLHTCAGCLTTYHMELSSEEVWKDTHFWSAKEELLWGAAAPPSLLSPVPGRQSAPTLRPTPPSGEAISQGSNRKVCRDMEEGSTSLPRVKWWH